jgi:polyphosphate kinase 2 (PPK2 family)
VVVSAAAGGFAPGTGMESEIKTNIQQLPSEESEGGSYGSDTISRIRKDPKAIGALFKEGKYPYTDKIPRSQYEKEKAALQIELLKVQNWVKITGQKIAIIFEGRDAAGKGGTIKRFMEHLNPRAAKVVALEKPTDHERGQWYFQRYVVHLPTKGEILFLDRSWYNRAGVERVMGFCDSGEASSCSSTTSRSPRRNRNAVLPHVCRTR